MTEKMYKVRSANVRWFILITFILALIIDSMRIITDSLNFLPPMALFVLLFWNSHVFDRQFFVSAFALGVLTDTLLQTTLGAHAALFLIFTFLMLRIRLQFQTYPIWQQAFLIGVYLFIYQVLNALFFNPLIDDGLFVSYWSMPAVGILLWPALSSALKRFTDQP
jgi:rod shape-determining protein MreD